MSDANQYKISFKKRNCEKERVLGPHCFCEKPKGKIFSMVEGQLPMACGLVFAKLLQSSKDAQCSSAVGRDMGALV